MMLVCLYMTAKQKGVTGCGGQVSTQSSAHDCVPGTFWLSGKGSGTGSTNRSRSLVGLFTNVRDGLRNMDLYLGAALFLTVYLIALKCAASFRQTISHAVTGFDALSMQMGNVTSVFYGTLLVHPGCWRDGMIYLLIWVSSLC